MSPDDLVEQEPTYMTPEDFDEGVVILNDEEVERSADLEAALEKDDGPIYMTPEDFDEGVVILDNEEVEGSADLEAAIADNAAANAPDTGNDLGRGW